MPRSSSRHLAIRPAPSSHRPRVRILDGLRLLAALLVLSWHYAAFGQGIDQTPYAQVPMLYPIAAYGWIGVEFFFVISGFVIGMSSMGRTLTEFVAARIARIYPAYWFAVLLTTTVLALWPVDRRPLPAVDVAINLTMLQQGFNVPAVDAVYWTLWAELHFYLLFALIVWRGATYRRVSAWCGVWLAVAFVGMRVGGGLNQLVLGDWAPFFVAGIAFFLIHRYGPTPLLWLYAAAGFVMGIDPLLRTLDRSNTHLRAPVPRWPAVVLMGLFFLLMAGIALGWIRANSPWLGVAGAITYPLYLIHEFIGWAILKSLRNVVPGSVLYLDTLTLMLAVAWLVHRHIERPLGPRLRRGIHATFTAYARRRRRNAPP